MGWGGLFVVGSWYEPAKRANSDYYRESQKKDSDLISRR